MHFVETVDLSGLGNRSYLAGGRRQAVAVDPPRDIDRVIGAAARRGVRIVAVVETHVHNDYVSGGLELARLTGAEYLVPAGAEVAFARTPVSDGDTFAVDEGLALTALATPGHTPHHTSYVLRETGSDDGPGDGSGASANGSEAGSGDGREVAAFTGGSLLIGTVGRPDLVEPRLTERLARAQHASVRRLADRLADEVPVLPTHGFGSFCSSVQAEGDETTIGKERGVNAALLRDEDDFVAELLAGLDDIPAYYVHMGPLNGGGPPPLDLRPPHTADGTEIARRLASGEWVVDLRNRVAFAEGHVAGSYNFEADGKLATYLAWLIPWGKPVTLLAESAGQLAGAQRELARVGMGPVAAATGDPASWAAPGEELCSHRRGSFADLAAVRAAGEPSVVLDVRRNSERAGSGRVAGSVHIPIHELHGRLHEVPAGAVWVHCAGGLRAAVAASMLDAVGREVIAVDDGFDAAEAAGLAVPAGEEH